MRDVRADAMTTALEPKLIEATRVSRPLMAYEAHTESAAPVITGMPGGNCSVSAPDRLVQGPGYRIGRKHARQLAERDAKMPPIRR